MNLLSYIKGFRKGKDAHRLEKEAMKDPFLADALEGYDKVKGDHIQSVETLQRQVTAKSRRKSYFLRNWSIAASILLLIGIGGFLVLQKKSYSPTGENWAQLEEQLISKDKENYPSPSPSSSSIMSGEQEATMSEPLANNAKNKESIQFTPPTIVRDESIKEDQKMSMSRELTDSKEMIAQEELAMADIADSNSEDKKITVEQVAATNFKDSQPSAKLKTQLFPGKNKIAGIVSDPQGEPIIGASVAYKGTAIGTVTNIDGYFELPLQDSNKQLSISYLGFESLTIKPDTSATMMIAMKENNDVLSEVVVVGRGVSKRSEKSTLKGSISTVKPEKFQDYVEREMIHPQDDECKNSKGKVEMTFYVDKQGRPYDIKIKKSLCPSADAEAIRLLESGPDWTLTDKLMKETIKF